VELAERSEPDATQLVTQDGLRRAAAALAGAVSRVAVQQEAQLRRASPVRDRVLPASSPQGLAEREQFLAAQERPRARKKRGVVRAREQ
jgi:hypothetical protein